MALAANQTTSRSTHTLESSHEVTFPQVNIATYVDYREHVVGADKDSHEQIAIELTGERGYRTCIAGHGLKHGDYYFEVEVLPYRTPTPFVDVVPAVRVGFTNFEEQ